MWPFQRGASPTEAADPESAQDEQELVEALRRGDESAFRQLVERHQASMLRVASFYVRDRAVAEEVVQETWVAVLDGLARFEQRSSLKTWIFRILSNRAKTRAQREGRSVPFSALAGSEEDDTTEPAVDPARFLDAEHPQAPRGWASPPHSWASLPHERLVSAETRERLRGAIEKLAPAQQTVIALRDVEGWSATEVCDLLEISEVNQRVLLHRARSRVRQALESYLEEEG